MEWATDTLATKREQEGGEEDDETPETSTGSEEELDATAKELLARSQPRGVEKGTGSTSTTRIEHNTLSKSERQAVRDRK